LPDIFISYARVDQERARPLAGALRAHGWDVWWDLASLRTGQSFSRAIRAALGQVQCVIVLWSRTSIDSRWVEAEASWAWENDKLASVVLDSGLRPPFPYHTMHAQDLSGWSGDAHAPAFRKLVADLTELVGSPKARPSAAGGASATASTERRQPAKPDWASAAGRDVIGEWAEISIPRGRGGPVIQRLRWIPPGRFQMGSPDDEPGRYDEEGPQHEVVITQGYWLFDTPCTQALWEAVMGDNPSELKSPERPVEQVSWEDVQQRFLPALNERFPGFVLPSEAQWEYACRAGTETALYTGPIEILGENNAPALDPIAWYGGNSGVDFDLKEGWDSSGWPEMQYPNPQSGTHPVARKQPNPWGLFDMLGNVWEWCEDTWHDSYKGGPADGSAWETDKPGAARVVRGGSWNYVARYCRCAFRGRVAPVLRLNHIGFRCARVQA
jgi:formylglycine-generating enzyme required for sulfatase activity